ncbi:MAG: hypothetical protein KF897_03405 [Opitutaceae bacterium]|nr:hypothetical protein [Opitutaceae bacterium]
MVRIRLHFLVILLPVLAGAQEPTGLEKAKQELKTLPAVRKESDRNPISLPNLAGPTPAADLPAPLPPTRHPGSDLDEAKKGKSSENWLVDAMMKGEDRRRSGTGRSDAGARAEGGLLDPEGERRERDPQRDLARDKDPLHAGRDGESPLAVVNPLEPFMTDWISRRDHALLLPKPAPGQGIGPETPAPLGGPDGSVTITFRGIDGRPDPIGAAPRPAAENPFLQALQAPAVPPPAMAPQPPPPAPAERGPALLPPDNARETRPPPPIDLAKPPDDRKYFPQLKRF